MKDIMVIGVAGGTGSGKTTLVNQLCKRFGSHVSVIYHDNYYKSHSDMSYEDRVQLNYDHPDAFETDLMIAHIQQLRDGKPVECPTYDYTQQTRSSKTITIEPAQVIIIEGILVFTSPELCNMMDIKIFVDTDADVRILRRILRDVEQRGRSIQSVVKQYLSTVKPMHEQYVEPSKRNADIIVLDGGHNLVALDMIMQRISNHLGIGCVERKEY